MRIPLTCKPILLVLIAVWISGGAGCVMDKAKPITPMFPAGKYPIVVVAHRGFSGVAPENTLVAFKKAIEVGSDMIELDVRLSKDGEVVVIHDESVERTTSGKGRVIDLTVEELKRLDAGSKFHPSFSGERIPSLREVMQLAHDRIQVNIELKNGEYGKWTFVDLAERTLLEVERAGMADRVFFSSFDPSILTRIKEKNHSIRTNLIFNKPWNSFEDVTGGQSFSTLTFRKSVLDRDQISKLHQMGIKINVYTLNTEEEMELFIQWGINGIITDYPDRLIQLLQKRNP